MQWYLNLFLIQILCTITLQQYFSDKTPIFLKEDPECLLIFFSQGYKMFYKFQKIRGLRTQPFLLARIVSGDVSLGEMSVTLEKQPYYLHSCCTLCEVSQNNYTCGKNKIKLLLCPQLVPRGTRTIRHFNKGHVCVMHVCSSMK